jgi:hypothetical protein
LLISTAEDREMADVRARPETMAALARLTKGETYSLAGTNWPSPAYAFSKAPAAIVEHRRTPFWDKAGWMALILALLATEWSVRRLRGLA